MNFREFAEKNTVILDGAMGTMLDKRGILPGELPETWNITHPDVISDIHRAYFDAGANVVNTNTFGANVLKYSSDELKKIIESAVICAKRALAESSGTQDKFIALDVGPLGKLIAPFGELTFDEAYRAFYETVKCGIACGVDLITLETMNDSLECKAALLAARELCQLPIIVTNVYGEDGKLMTGATPEVMAAMLEGLGADYIGANCSLGPDALLPVAERLISELSVPCVLKPNAGLPRVVSGRTVYDVSAEDFARGLVRATELGVRFVGGCCGTTPEYIACLSKMLNSKKPLPIERKNKTVITSFCRVHTFDGAFTVIGESLNPTGKKRMKEAVRSHDIDYIVNIGVSEEECGADALDVNVGLPDISERDFLPKVISALQYATSCPLVIDTSDVSALENALRIYNGKAMINSVNGKPESMRAVFPLQKKYGGVVIALTLDEKGIPDTAEERFEIAKRILETAAEYGIDKKDIVFDPLAMTVSTNTGSAQVTLDAVRMIREQLGAKTSLGVSNISFGLPSRDALNSAFLSMSMASGLSAAIVNPASEEMKRSVLASRALLGLDEGFRSYTEAADALTHKQGSSTAPIEGNNVSLSESIFRGMKDAARMLTEKMLVCADPMHLISAEIIPALDKVGLGFERGEIYLPGLLLAAEAAGAAFDVIKAKIPSNEAEKRGKIVIATVKGDIHDIGKNIVKLLLENYGFCVVDLGKDVAPTEILEAARRERADIVALSALMTTTVPAMQEAVKLVKDELPGIKTLVGGAVLTESYAMAIGADAYAKDAMAAVRYAEGALNG